MNYVLDDKGNKIEGLSKEEVLSVMQQAIDNGSLAGIDKDSAFVSKLKCCVSGGTFSVAFATQAKYNELKANNQLVVNCLYIITDDETGENIETSLENLNTDMSDIKGRLDALGFKQGSVILADGVTATQNELKRQGNYVIGDLTISISGGFAVGIVIGTIPKEFLPENNKEIGAIVDYRFSIENFTGVGQELIKGSIDTNGNITLWRDRAFAPKYDGSSYTVSTSIVNPIVINFGYEAKPLIADEEQEG